MNNREVLLNGIFVICAIAFLAGLVWADIYAVDIYFTIPDSVLMTGERIEIKGGLFLANYTDNGTLVSSSAAISGGIVNITIRNNATNAIVYESNNSILTDSNGRFYSNSSYSRNSSTITAPSTNGSYYIRAEYIDPNNETKYSEIDFLVVNKQIDTLEIIPDKASYYVGESMVVDVFAIRQIGDSVIYVSNVSVSGSVRNSTKDELRTFSCVTGKDGKCSVSVIAPTTTGSYLVELNNFKAFSSFNVVPFLFNTYMADELGNSLKNIFARGEQARVEVSVANASTSDSYLFSGYIADSSGNSVKAISATTLNSNNSFTNSFLFTVDSLTFACGSYTAEITLSKSGGGSMSASTSFEVRDWSLSLSKRSTNSGFEYGFSVFPNKTMRLELSPSFRVNGSVIPNVSASSFSINLKDNLDNLISSTNVSWNASCGSTGCYEFSLNSPTTTGKYTLETSLSYEGSTRTESRAIEVINKVMSVQSSDKDGNLKELFGTNEFAYISISAYNLSAAAINLSDAEMFLMEYMNGSSFSYTQVGSFAQVNSSNSVYEWAWNASSQRIKMDVPKIGGLYNVFVLGDNMSVGATAKVIVNPYDVCSVPKNTPGSVTSGYYYVWQFKTTDTVYFELKITQANNPLGKASFGNGTNTSSYGMGSACNVDTTTKQVISNATISILEVRNAESGAVQSINSSESTCQASDSSGGYSCTVKPLSKWDGGPSIVKFAVSSTDGTYDISYGAFEARAFYLYGYSQTWQNNPRDNLSLIVQIYEAGTGWWGGGGNSGGLSGTITLKKVEYQGRDGEWVWPPISYDYNVSKVNSSSVTGGTGRINLSAANAPGGIWKTGYYRAVIEGVTSNGDSDYGYVWFGIKNWDVYGQPIECTSTGCNYKNYFNSRENITLYVKVSNAGSYNYYDNGRENLGGNISIGVKKIEDCRKWPCRELNTTEYTASTIYTNESSPWYWSASSNQSNYMLTIRNNVGSWGTGYYNVVLDVNGSDTGYAWFNTIAFYVESNPTNVNGSDYIYMIKNNQRMYFNITAVKSYKNGYWSGGTLVRYNSSDYLNVTIDSAVLRTWSESLKTTLEYNYPSEINVTPLTIRGNTIVNVSYLNGSWPTGYYWGELSLKNSQNETSSASMWFGVKPFRVELSNAAYTVDREQCINASVTIYEPYWWPYDRIYGNFSVSSVYEDAWSYSSATRTEFSNHSSSSFNGSATINICPNNNSWGIGSWGGYHYLNVVITDNVNNNSEIGWLSFRAVPFSVSWGSVIGGNSKLYTESITTPVTLTKSVSGASALGNLTSIYQWRYDSTHNGKQEYVFKVGNCYSNVSRQCIVNGTQNVTIYPPSEGWNLGYNYLYAQWTGVSDSSMLDDWNGVYFEGKEVYSGYFNNVDRYGNYKYDFRNNENLTIRLYVNDVNNNAADATITSVSYSFPSGGSCWNDWCRTYTSADWSLAEGGTTTGSDGQANIIINVPSSGWTLGYGYIKVGVSGGSGSASISNGGIRVKDFTPPNISVVLPSVNQSLNSSTFAIKINSNENAHCYLNLYNYNSFYNSYSCANFMNSSNGSSSSNEQFLDSCNQTKYGFNGTKYHYQYIDRNYRMIANENYTYWYSYDMTDLVTDALNHTYTFNTTDPIGGGRIPSQSYTLIVSCYDNDYNYASGYSAFKFNSTGVGG